MAPIHCPVLIVLLVLYARYKLTNAENNRKKLHSSGQTSGPNVLVVYFNDDHNATGQVASCIAEGAVLANANVRLYEAIEANFDRDVVWADAIILGSGVYNGNPAPELLSFLNSFDIETNISRKIGSAFVTAGSAVAGAQPVLEALNRGLQTFNMVMVGGSDWKNSEATASNL